MSTKKKSKTTMKILFIFLAILVLVLVGAILYFYLTGDIFEEAEETGITCGCYYIDPQVTSTCGDTKRAFKFNIEQGTLQNCTASCPLSDLSSNTLYSTTPEDAYVTCTTRNIPNIHCNFMEVKTESGLIVTGKIAPEDVIVINATFDSTEYTDYQFLINNVPTEPDEIEGNRITKVIDDLGEASTLQISAQAKNNRGDTVSSIICNRLIEITTTARAGVTALTLDVTIQDNVPKIREAIINVGGLEEKETTLEFSFKDDIITMNQGFDLEAGRGRISIPEESLYNEDNFTGGDTFSLLNRYSGEILVTVEVVQENNSLGTASTEINLPTLEEITWPGEEEEEEEEEQEQEQEEEEEEEVIDEYEKSNFTVNKTSSQICVERIEPDNTTTFTITVKNNSSINDTIESIKDKLPLGFEYVEDSSNINGSSITDSQYVTVTTVGESQEIVWEPSESWLIGSGSTLTLYFEAIAGENALSGNNLNEVIVTPTEIPEDPSTLRSSVELVVAQDCDDVTEVIPQTNIFDTIIGRIFVGLLIIVFGYSIYNTKQGNNIAKAVLDSSAYKNAEMTSYKIFKPRKYFEEKILQRRERKR